MARPLRIAVVGGGISGLAAAWGLRTAVAQAKAEVELFESGPRWGGTVATERVLGHVIEKGPDSFVTRKPETMTLVRELGLERDIVRVKNRRMYIYCGGRFRELPPVSPLGIPTSVPSLVRSDLFSPGGKIRATWDLLCPRSGLEPGGKDISVGAFLRRRLGDQVVDRLVSPLAGGVHLTEVDHLSLQAVLPQLLELEREHRSLILAAARGGRQGSPASGASPFMTLQGGLQSLTDTLVQRLDFVRLHVKETVSMIEPKGTEWRLVTAGGQSQDFDRVILAAPCHVLSELLKASLPSLSGLLAELRYSPVAAVGLVYGSEVVPPGLDGSGFMVPRSEGLGISGVTWIDRKWDHGGVPQGFALRVYVSQMPGFEGISSDDAQILEVVGNGLRKTMGVEQAALYAGIYRHSKAMPQYRVGHLEWVKKVQHEVRAHPGLALAGAAFEGVGLSDCIRSGKRAATHALRPRPAS